MLQHKIRAFAHSIMALYSYEQQRFLCFILLGCLGQLHNNCFTYDRRACQLWIIFPTASFVQFCQSSCCSIPYLVIQYLNYLCPVLSCLVVTGLLFGLLLCSLMFIQFMSVCFLLSSALVISRSQCPPSLCQGQLQLRVILKDILRDRQEGIEKDLGKVSKGQILFVVTHHPD